MRQINYSCILSLQFLRFKRNFNLVKIPIYINRKGECNNKHYVLFVTTFVKLKMRQKCSFRYKKIERKTWEIELLIYRIYCWETKNKSFREMRKKSTIQRRSLSTSDKRTKTMKLLGAKHTKKQNRRHESTFEILLVEQQKFNFWQIWHLKSLNSCLNCRSYVSQHEVFLPAIWQYIRAADGGRERIKSSQQFDFLKNRFHSQLLCLLTLIFGFFCRSLLCLSYKAIIVQSHIFFSFFHLAPSKATKCKKIICSSFHETSIML